MPHFCQIENDVEFDRAPLDLHKTVIEYHISPQVIYVKALVKYARLHHDIDRFSHLFTQHGGSKRITISTRNVDKCGLI